MKKEFTTQLLACSNEILPISMDRFFLNKTSRGKLVFCNADQSNSSLWLFVILWPDNKRESINVHLGWSSDGTIPEYFIVDSRSFDIMGAEITLDRHSFPLSRFSGNIETPYDVIPLPDTIEELINYTKPVFQSDAISLVRKTIESIRSDLDRHGVPYFEWLIASKCCGPNK
jgi:hypothetical protein